MRALLGRRLPPLGIVQILQRRPHGNSVLNPPYNYIYPRIFPLELSSVLRTPAPSARSASRGRNARPPSVCRLVRRTSPPIARARARGPAALGRHEPFFSLITVFFSCCIMSAQVFFVSVCFLFVSFFFFLLLSFIFIFIYFSFFYFYFYLFFFILFFY